MIWTTICKKRNYTVFWSKFLWIRWSLVLVHSQKRSCYWIFTFLPITKFMYINIDIWKYYIFYHDFIFVYCHKVVYILCKLITRLKGANQCHVGEESTLFAIPLCGEDTIGEERIHEDLSGDGEPVWKGRPNRGRSSTNRA